MHPHSWNQTAIVNVSAPHRAVLRVSSKANEAYLAPTQGSTRYTAIPLSDLPHTLTGPLVDRALRNFQVLTWYHFSFFVSFEEKVTKYETGVQVSSKAIGLPFSAIPL